MNIALTIAGSDPCAGAGVQADIKTFAACGVYGTCVISAVTAQNTNGVQAVYHLPAQIVRQQLESILSDLPPQALKTGMMGNSEIVRLVAEAIREHKLCKLVIDPVILAKNGTPLLDREAWNSLREELIPLAYLITPNLAEAEMLSGIKIHDLPEMEETAKYLHRLGCQKVLIKGALFGDEGQVRDMYYDGQRAEIISHPYIPGGPWHGTGCTLSAAITAGLAKGDPARQAVKTAVEYTQAAIRHAWKPTQGYYLL